MFGLLDQFNLIYLQRTGATMIYYFLMAIEIISYNVQQGIKIKAISSWAVDKDPDVLCLQEFPENAFDGFAPKYRKIFAASFNKKGLVYGELITYKPNL